MKSIFENFSEWVINHVAELSLLISCSSFLSIVLFFVTGNVNAFIINLFPVYFNFFGSNFSTLYLQSLDGIDFALDILWIFLILIILIGSFLYVKSKERKLLYFSYGIIFIGCIVSLLYFLIEIIFQADLSKIYRLPQVGNHNNWLIDLIRVVIYLFLIIISFILLRHWSKGSNILKIEKSIESDNIKSNKWKRFFHFIVDFIILSFITTRIMIVIINILSYSLDASTYFHDIAEIVLLFVFILIYYFTFEYLFHITPAKILTHTKLYSIKNEKLKSSKVLKRSLARHIPFDQISFLFSN
ncbi:MAG: hypothetical protein CMC05_03000, partial [Flavobacteriaceae bacterium]|nr:hypothetical protein [Flavobacteriaceae bacterium]